VEGKMKEAKIQEAMAKKGKYRALTIGQLKDLEGTYPDIEGDMSRTYERLAWTYSTILTNSGVKTSMEDVYELPSTHPLCKMLVDFLTDGIPAGNAGGSISIEPAESGGDGAPQK